MTDLRIPQPGMAAPKVTPLLALRDFNGVAKRNLLRSVRTPQMILYLVQPVMMLILFRYMFGGAIKVSGTTYVNFVVPAIFLLAGLIGAMTSAIGIADDLKSGMIDRFRSMPMARSAFLAGRSLTDLIKSIVTLAVLVGLGVAVGFRFHAGVGPVLLGLVLVLAFGYAFSWVMAAIGLSSKDPESAQNAATGPVFLLLFASNAIVPAETLPGWLQGFARNQPLGVTTSAVRALFEGQDAAKYVWPSLGWSIGITVVFFAISLALYQKATAH
jgi:ABC-2 type transport system permease protein/oleandomycin transport system permease protein